MADSGTKLIVKRGNKTYAITPLSDEDLHFTPEVIEKIELSLKQAKEGKVTKVRTAEELVKFLESL